MNFAIGYSILQCNIQLCDVIINCAMLFVQYNTQCNNELCNGAGGWLIIRVWPFPALGTSDAALRRQLFIHLSIFTNQIASTDTFHMLALG